MTMTSEGPPIKLSVTASHDGGNIQLISQTDPFISDRAAKSTVKLNVAPDVYTEFEKVQHLQYFSFRVFVSGLEDAKVLNVTYVIDNADSVSYPQAWSGTTVCQTVSHIYSYLKCACGIQNCNLFSLTKYNNVLSFHRVVVSNHQMMICGIEI